tara:strand:- start:4136 stop:5071 length:936 start_codon:yes stop_codon:yes gene_type:complete
MDSAIFTPVRFPNYHLAEECRFVLTQDIDPDSNFDGIFVIDSQYNLMCGGHAVNNLLQHRVINRCDLIDRAYIDQVVDLIKQADPSLQVYSCDKPRGIRLLEAGVMTRSQLEEEASDDYPLENKSDHVYENSEIALENIKRNLSVPIGFIESDGHHYVSWVRSENGHWYRIDSIYEGVDEENFTKEQGGSVCKFTTENMLRYVESLPEIAGDEIFKGACRLVVVTLEIFQGLQGSSFRRERELPQLPPLRQAARLTRDSFRDFVSASGRPPLPTYEEIMRLHHRNKPPLPTYEEMMRLYPRHQEDDNWILL